LRELSGKEECKQISDPIYGVIRLCEPVISVVDTREYQRLRHIKQLGTVYLAYPGANHTRFEHSLGVYLLSEKMAKKFELEDILIEIAMAGLLHDIGHGPYSHLLEELPNAKWNHTKEGIKIIKNSEINDILSEYGVNVRKVIEYIQGKGDYGFIISGEIDADRMDYILRDAHYTGVGVTYDFHRILQVLDIVDSELVVHEKGLTAIEGFLIARHIMYSRVYLHHVTRASEGMLRKAIRDLIESGEADINDLTRLDDYEFWATLKQGTNFSREIVQRIYERRLYKRALELRWTSVPEDLKRELITKKMTEKLEEEIAEECGIEENYVIVDASPLHVDKEIRLKVMTADGEMKSLYEVSSLARSLRKSQLDIWRLWVFTPKELRDHVGRISRRVLGI